MPKQKSRRTLHITPEDLIKLRKLQGKIKAITGQEPSLTILIKKIMSPPNFDNFEKEILNRISNKDIIQLKFDKELI
ncbi:hypothetical protein LCGC14_2434750 [marine sediment metagenome]|uniref:Uncharacterized protein n=1 Tax=marine sediment metagenome TaxID=412755 RepID=A0A0F9DXU0_9ZZZZ